MALSSDATLITTRPYGYFIFNPVMGQTDPDQDRGIIQGILEPEIKLEIYKKKEANKVVLNGRLVGTALVELECFPGGLTVLMPIITEPKLNESLECLLGLKVEPMGSSDFQ